MLPPLMVASGMGRHDDFAPEEEKRALEAVKVLVEMGADVNQATETGWKFPGRQVSVP